MKPQLSVVGTLFPLLEYCFLSALGRKLTLEVISTDIRTLTIDLMLNKI